MEIPKICRYCGGKIKLTTTKEIYEKSEKPIYLCTNCGAYVHCHCDRKGGPTRPMGKLANPALRAKRRETHEVFDGFWQAQGMTRTQAYKWLARKLCKPERLAHMSRGLICRSMCADCAYHYRTGPEAERHAEDLLRSNKRYCLGAERARQFRRGDPTRYVPDWCPRQIKPVRFRVYDYKDIEAFCCANHTEGWSPPAEPDARLYALCYDLDIEMDAETFYRRSKRAPLSSLCGVAVHRGSVLEIDDGIRPVYLCWSGRDLWSVTFDAGLACRNEYRPLPIKKEQPK